MAEPVNQTEGLVTGVEGSAQAGGRASVVSKWAAGSMKERVVSAG